MAKSSGTVKAITDGGRLLLAGNVAWGDAILGGSCYR